MCHLSKGGGRRGRSSGAPRSQSRIPETTTLTVTKARIASDTERPSSRATRRRKRLSCANIRAIRWRRCARWTMTRLAKTNPTSAWMALRIWRSCRVPSAAAAKARRPKCTSQRDQVRHAVRDRARRSARASAARPRAAPWFSVSMDVSSQSGCSSRPLGLRPHGARLRILEVVTAARRGAKAGSRNRREWSRGDRRPPVPGWSDLDDGEAGPVPSPFTTSGLRWPGGSSVTIATCTAEGLPPSERP
jgi:hypothetical protein